MYIILDQNHYHTASTVYIILNMPDFISQRYHDVQQRLITACKNANIDSTGIELLAVSKTQPSDAIKTCYELGQRCFGENYLQDALPKIQELTHLEGIQWHFIGPLQSNKTKAVAEHFQWLETLSRLKIAQRLDRQRPRYLEPLNVLVQVNISNEAQKEGIKMQDVADFCRQLLPLKMLKLRGLMCIAEHTDNKQILTEQYGNMAKLFNQLKAHFPDFDRLSMGMSGDMELAITQGSNEVRIGTDIFGKRNK